MRQVDFYKCTKCGIVISSNTEKSEGFNIVLHAITMQSLEELNINSVLCEPCFNKAINSMLEGDVNDTQDTRNDSDD